MTEILLFFLYQILLLPPVKELNQSFFQLSFFEFAFFVILDDYPDDPLDSRSTKFSR